MKFDPTDYWFTPTEEHEGVKHYRAILHYDDDEPCRVVYFCIEFPTYWEFSRRIQTITEPGKLSSTIGLERMTRISKAHDCYTIEALARESDCLPPYEIT